MTLNPWLPLDVIRRFGNAVDAAIEPKPGDCVPVGTVVLSIVNQRMASLRELSLRRVAHLQCFMRRVVTLCLGGFQDPRGGSCVSAATNLPHSHGGLHRSEVWNQFSWAKWPLLHAALARRQTRFALFVDADVLILSNPFDRMPPSLLGAHAPSFVHQEELPSCANPSCGGEPCRINTGMLLASSAPLCREVLRQLHPSASSG